MYWSLDDADDNTPVSALTRRFWFKSYFALVDLPSSRHKHVNEPLESTMPPAQLALEIPDTHSGIQIHPVLLAPDVLRTVNASSTPPSTAAGAKRPKGS